MKIGGSKKNRLTDWASILLLPSNKPICLIWLKLLLWWRVKMWNAINWQHCSFEEEFPPNSERRTQEIKSLKRLYQGSSKIHVKSMTQQQIATECLLRVAWVLGKHKKPFFWCGFSFLFSPFFKENIILFYVNIWIFFGFVTCWYLFLLKRKCFCFIEYVFYIS